VPHVVFEDRRSGRQLLVSIWVPGSVPGGAVEAAVRGAWPGAATTTEPATEPIPAIVCAQTGGRLPRTFGEWLPLRTDHDADPLRALLAAGAQLRPGEYACVQVLARPASPRRAAGRGERPAGRLGDGSARIVNPAAPLRWVFQTGSSAQRGNVLQSGAMWRDPGVDRDVRAVLGKTAHPLWETAIRYAVAGSTGRAGADSQGRVRGVADAVASAFAVYTGRNRLTHRAGMRMSR
jgi:hypothetical protein